MKLLLFLIAEFLHMVVAAYLIVILFFGGWHLWGITGWEHNVTWVTAILRILVLTTKVLAVIVFFMMVRWSWPRFRFDQLMALAWKVLLPLGLINLFAVAVMVEYGVLHDVHPLVLIVAGWIVAFVGWIGAAMASPLHSDNRPRAAVHQFDAEAELTRMPR